MWFVGILILVGLVVVFQKIILAFGYQQWFELYKSQGKDDKEASQLAWAEVDKILASSSGYQVPWP